MNARCSHVDHKGRQCKLPAGAHTAHSYTSGPRQFGKKALRELPAIDACREAVKARSGGACECWHAEACGRDDQHFGHELHHLAPSDRDKGMHEQERCLWLCRTAHGFVHRAPEQAYELGLLLRSGAA